jgi:prepilin-type N-terminal cleavage/methylation domain-containing protein
MKKTKGFTLIELLVVIAIIGILSSITVVSLNSARARGRDAKRIADVKQIQLALSLYYDACGREYPTPSSGLLSASANQGCSGGTTMASF